MTGRAQTRGGTPVYRSSLWHGTSRRAAAAIAIGGFRPGPGGILFATSFRGEAEGFSSGGAVLPVTVTLNRPLIVSEQESLGDILRGLGIKPDPTPDGERAIAAAVQELGYDGIVQQLTADERDPSDRYPAREIVRFFDPAAITIAEPAAVEAA